MGYVRNDAQRDEINFVSFFLNFPDSVILRFWFVAKNKIFISKIYQHYFKT